MLHECDGHLEIFILAALKLQKILGNICLSEQVFHRKQPLGARDTTPCLFVRVRDRFQFLCAVGYEPSSYSEGLRGYYVHIKSGPY